MCSCFVDLLGERNPHLADALLDVYATANGGKRHRGEAGKLRDSGARRGVPDIEIWIPHGGYHGMVIELKAARSGRATPEQRSRIERLRARGYRADICHGWVVAARCLCDYLSISIPDDAELAVECRVMTARAARKKRRRRLRLSRRRPHQRLLRQARERRPPPRPAQTTARSIKRLSNASSSRAISASNRAPSPRIC